MTALQIEINQKVDPIMQFNEEKAGNGVRSPLSLKILDLTTVKLSKNRFSYHVPRITTEFQVEMNQKVDPIMQMNQEKAGNGIRSPLSSKIFDTLTTQTRPKNYFSRHFPRLSRVSHKLAIKKEDQNIKLDEKKTEQDVSGIAVKILNMLSTLQLLKNEFAYHVRRIYRVDKELVMQYDEEQVGHHFADVVAVKFD
jgi:hypothetical protein